MINYRKSTFHGYYDARHIVRPGSWGTTETILKHFTVQERTLSYRFYTHLHPYVEELVRRLLSRSVRGLLDADTATPPLGDTTFFEHRYRPSPEMVEKPYPIKNLDFTSSGAYSVYNWELFFHVPFTVAVHLSKNQRFEDAQRWFHYIFDPTDDSEGPTPARYWKVRPFQTTDVESIEKILLNLSTGADPDLRDETVAAIEAWKDAPFRPHVIARHRPSAYMLKTVMAYLDNLIAWGDSLFRQDTIETINEATQLYVLAANLLGPRPQAVPKKGAAAPQSYADLRPTLTALGNALVKLETDIPLDTAPHPGDPANLDRMVTLSSIGKTLYFCVPQNDKLLEYWDIVADRLFKIHNSLNLQGVFRRLPLFEPPLDPALLARAAAAGTDVLGPINGMGQPLVRFAVLVQKASEICQEVKALGGHLLAAIEKEDNEALAVLRAKHEKVILSLAEVVRYGQWQEAIKTKEGLYRSLASATQRYTYYERLLGKKPNEIELPGFDPLDVNALLEMRIETNEAEVGLRPIEIDIAEDPKDLGGGKKISSHEVQELEKLKEANKLQGDSAKLDMLASAAAFIPQFDIHGTPLGVGLATSFGGVQISKVLSLLASYVRMEAGEYSYKANRAAKIGGYARREQDWAYQSNLAAGEYSQILKQLRAAEIREAVAKREWENHKQQMTHAEEIEHFLTDEHSGKTSNQALYAWMKREVRSLYAKSYELAFDIARKAERALQYELGKPDASFITYGHRAGKEGLFAGEKLYLDVKRMEMAYHELNQREYELTKHVSLRDIDPGALLQLRATGRCLISLPEELFDMDGPGHYFRRIRSMAVSIPCVVGPYVSVNCTLTLTKSTLRKSSVAGTQYESTGDTDPRFETLHGSQDTIVTSSAQHDSGLFEANLRDERYLPFEGRGAVSAWQLRLPADPSQKEPRQFDYDTISDVIFHVRYTAREGGDVLRKAATNHLAKLIEQAQAAGSVRLLSIRHDFTAAWVKLRSAVLTTTNRFAELTLELGAEHYPFWSGGRLEALKAVELFASTGKNVIEINQAADGSGKKDSISKNATYGELRSGKLVHIPLPPPTGKLTLYLDDNAMEDLWIALTWGV